MTGTHLVPLRRTWAISQVVCTILAVIRPSSFRLPRYTPVAADHRIARPALRYDAAIPQRYIARSIEPEEPPAK